MKCPVCKTDVGDLHRCYECGFDQICKDFISVEDAENWKRNVVEPYVLHWRKQTLDNYLKHTGINQEVELLERQIEHSPSVQKNRLKLINYFYKLLIEPAEPLPNNIAQELISKCLYYISDTTFSENSISDRIRKIKVRYTNAVLLLMSGQLRAAYDMFCEIALGVDELYQSSNRLYKDASIVYFYAEASIHQIKVLAGLDDEDFFFVDREEIRFHQNFGNYKFEENDFLYIFNYHPIFSMSNNPYYEVFDSKGKYFQCMGKNINWLSVKGLSNTEYIVKYRFWEIICNNADFYALADYILTHPYHKQNGYIHKIMAIYNQD